MALIDNYTSALNPIVQAQVTTALYGYANNVYSEASTVTNHTTRAAFANEVVNGRVALQPLIATACAFASLTDTSTDTTVSNAVAALWNLFAGA